MSTRIYLVKDADIEHLVEASSASQALMKVCKDVFKVEVATSKKVAELMQKGVKLINASESGQSN
jgi:hypothetical protein